MTQNTKEFCQIEVSNERLYDLNFSIKIFFNPIVVCVENSDLF